MLRTRVLLAILLAGLAGGLSLLLLLEPAASPPGEQAPVRDLADLGVVVDTVLGRHGIPRDAIRTWKVLSPDRRVLRIERRVAVPPEFVSVRFTHDLGSAVEEFGARVIATERTREQTVTVHVRKDGVVVQSISLVTTPRRPAAAGTRRRAGAH